MGEFERVEIRRVKELIAEINALKETAVAKLDFDVACGYRDAAYNLKKVLGFLEFQESYRNDS